ncbi:hypothetical protein RBB50_005942 [Rhinocladiella similis]
MPRTIVPCPKGDTDILVKIIDDDREYTIPMRKRDKLRDLMKKFWRVSCKSPRPALFTFKGKKLRARSTIASLNLVHDDTIQYQATGKSLEEGYYEELVTLAQSCKQFSDNLRRILPYIPAAWFQTPIGYEQERLFEDNVCKVESKMRDLQRLRYALNDPTSWIHLASAECFLAAFIVDMFNYDDILCDTVFTSCDQYLGRATVAKICLQGAVNRKDMFKTTSSLSTIRLWPNHVTGLASEDTAIGKVDLNHMPDTSTSQNVVNDNGEVCLICHDPVELPTLSDKRVSPDVVATPCCHKLAHTLCLGEWFMHSIYSYQVYQTGTCPHCRAIFSANDVYRLYDMGLFLMASRGVYRTEIGFWASSWCDLEIALSFKRRAATFNQVNENPRT